MRFGSIGASACISRLHARGGVLTLLLILLVAFAPLANAFCAIEHVGAGVGAAPTAGGSSDSDTRCADEIGAASQPDQLASVANASPSGLDAPAPACIATVRRDLFPTVARRCALPPVEPVSKRVCRLLI
jgi:hypothetical protein